MRYFVTGATGFIGGRLAALLREDGHEVVAIARDPDRARSLADLGVHVHRGDITDRESLRGPMTGADGVFHVAGWYQIGARDRSMARRINVDGTRNVLEMMRELGIPKGVYTSTVAVFSDTRGQIPDESYRYDGPHLSEYDRTKWEAHYLVAEPMIAEGLPLVIVQPGLVYGIGDTSLLRQTLIQYLRGQLPFAPLGTAFCWAHVDDVARGHMLAMERGKPGETYIIAGDCHTLIEALEMAAGYTGIPAPRVHVPPPVMKAFAAVAALVERVVPLPPTYRSETLRVNAGVTYMGSNAKARRELGYNPRPLREGMREVLDHEMRALGLTPPASRAS